MTTPDPRMRAEASVDADSQRSPVEDVSGYAIFAAGEMGSAHVMAHQKLDNGQVRSGHHRLGEWLSGRTGAGSEWVHLHFHMAIFELEVGEWDAAHARFLAQVLPAAATGDALTDAPGLLWRLAIASPAPVALPWQSLRRAALTHMAHTRDPFVQLHNLLALAGAGDDEGIERWLQARPPFPRPDRSPTVERAARALRSVAAGSFRQAGAQMQRVLPAVAAVGGSHAQNQLFAQLAQWCTRQAADAVDGQLYANAA